MNKQALVAKMAEAMARCYTSDLDTIRLYAPAYYRAIMLRYSTLAEAAYEALAGEMVVHVR